MREVKFRAWDDKEKVIISADDLAFETYLPLWMQFKGSTLKFMQYTGLKDKNGKEIYEGDIILYDRNINDRVDKYKFKVEWLEGYYYLEGLKNMVWIDYDINWELTEVVGNIYENQELI